MFTLRQIEAFKAIMDTGMVLSAADAMCLSQPAVSRLLSDLETELGYPLFDRRKGRLVPRREARDLYTKVESSFSGLRQIEAEARRIGRRAASQLRVAALPALSTGPVPRAVKQFLASNPAASLSIQTRSRHLVMEAVVDDCYDLGLTTLPVAHPDIETATVARLPFHCIMHPGHPLTRLNAVGPQDLDGVDMIAVAGEAPLRLRRLKDEMFREFGARPVIRVECTVMSVACALAADGIGVLLAPPSCISDQARSHLRVVPFAPEIAVDIVAIRPAGQAMGSLTAAFIDRFRGACRPDNTRLEIPAVA